MLQPSSHFLCSENCRNNRYAFTAADALVLVLLHTLVRRQRSFVHGVWKEALSCAGAAAVVRTARGHGEEHAQTRRVISFPKNLVAGSVGTPGTGLLFCPAC